MAGIDHLELMLNCLSHGDRLKSLEVEEVEKTKLPKGEGEKPKKK